MNSISNARAGEEVEDDEQWCACRRRRVGRTCGDSNFATTTTKAELIVLCTERVQEQMAGAGCREEAVSALMLEKEKDLELAAKIGQNLLAENRELQMRNEFLEQQLNCSDDKVGQLKTALQRKADLLHMVTDDVEAAASPLQSPYSPLSICEDFGPIGGRQSRASFRSLGGRSTRALQSKLGELEEENASLRLEASNLRKVTQELEVKESKIVTDCMKQLANANEQIELLHGELVEKVEENDVKQSVVNRLHQEAISRQTSEQSLSIENDELAGQLRAAEEIQGELTQEIMDLQERYAEVVAMLHEAQQELKQFRRPLHRSYSPDSAVYESLASELEQSDGSAGHSSVFSPRVPPPAAQQQPPSASSEARLLSAIDELSPATETNLAAEMNHQWTAGGCCLPAALEGEGGGGGLQMFDPDSRRNVPPSMEETVSAMSAADEASRSSNSNNSLSKSSSSSLDSLGSDEGKGAGVPGRPGSKDLAWSLKRHNANKQLERCYQKFLQRSRSFRLPAVEPNFAAAKRASLRKRVDPQDKPALKVKGSVESDSPRLSGALERLKFASYSQGLDFVSAAAVETATDSSFRSSSAEQSVGSFAMSSTTGAEASPASSHQFSAHSGIVSRREVALARCGSATCSPGAWESSAKAEPQAEQRSRRAVHKSKLVASNSMLEEIRRRLSADLIGLHAFGGLSREPNAADAIKSPADVDSLD